MRFDVQLPDGTRADCVLCDRYGRSLAVIEAKCSSVNLPATRQLGARAYAQQLSVPYTFLCDDNEVSTRCWASM